MFDDAEDDVEDGDYDVVAAVAEEPGHGHAVAVAAEHVAASPASDVLPCDSGTRP